MQAVAWTALGAWVVRARARVRGVLSWSTAALLWLGVLGYALSFLVQLWPGLLAPVAETPPHLRQTVLAQRNSLMMYLVEGHGLSRSSW